METSALHTFISRADELRLALDRFVDEQRSVSGAVRVRDWQALERALDRASAASIMVTVAEDLRNAAWSGLLAELGLPADSSVFRVSLAVPLETRSLLTDAYRNLRLSAMRARIENQALDAFVGVEGSTLSKVIEELYPMRKGKIYGKTGKARAAAPESMVLNAAF